MYMYMRNRAKYVIRRDEIRGRIRRAQRRKIQSVGKRKLSIRDTMAYTVTSVYVPYVTTVEWIIGICGISYPMRYENVFS